MLKRKKKSLHRGIKHKLISTKTSSRSTAQYLLRRRSVPKKVDTFSESSCRLDFPSRSQTRLRGNTWHSRPIQTLSPTNNCWHSCAALSLPTKKRKGQNWNATAERKAERLAAVCLSPVFLCFHFSLLPGFSAVSVATTLLSPPCLPLCSFFPLLASLLLPLRLPLKKKKWKTNPSSNSGKALPACLPACAASPSWEAVFSFLIKKKIKKKSKTKQDGSSKNSTGLIPLQLTHTHTHTVNIRLAANLLVEYNLPRPRRGYKYASICSVHWSYQCRERPGTAAHGWTKTLIGEAAERCVTYGVHLHCLLISTQGRETEWKYITFIITRSSN